MLRPTPCSVALLAAAVALALTAKFYFSTAPVPAESYAADGGPARLAGAPAQSFTIPGLDGKSDALARHRGHVVLVNLWASWCAPCRSETPALERLYEAEHARGLIVLGIDQGESPATAATFAHDLKLRYPILLDQEQRYGRAYAAIGLPTTLIIDPTGHIVRGIDGELTLAQMHAAVDPLLRPRRGL